MSLLYQSILVSHYAHYMVIVQVVRALEGNLSLSDLNDGVKPGFSSAHGSTDLDSGTEKEEAKKFKKLVFLSEDYASTDFGRTRSQFNDGLSSGEMQRQT